MPNQQTHVADDYAADLPIVRRGIPAWILSFAMHGTIFAVMLFTIRQVPRGAEVEGDREAGIVLVKNSPEQAEYLTSGDMNSNAGDNADSTQPLSESLPSAQSMESDLAGLLPSNDNSSGNGTGFETGLPGPDGLISGVSDNQELGGKVTTQIFGVQGTGSKFIYVFDRSTSMNGFNKRPINAAKEQLIASLESLGESHQFQIIFYNEVPNVFNPSPDLPPRMLSGSEANKQAAIRFIRNIPAIGGTEHVPAIQKALSLSPDVIFFLTDAQEPRLNENQLRKINSWNQSAASINTIEFGSGKNYNKNNFLVRLARDNFGQHVYKDVTQFGGHK